MTNAFKHAFPGKRSGTVCVSFEHNDGGYALEVRDDGVGLPQGYSIDQSETLGMQLVALLTCQLGGVVRVCSEAGTAIRVSWPA